MKHKRLAIVMAVLAGLAAVAPIAGQLYDRRGVPDWAPDEEFKHDIFTFVRIEYSDGPGQWGYDGGYGRRGRGGGYGGGRGGGHWGRWATDYPDSDLNFSYRLHQLTSLEVDPEGIVLRLTDPELFDYPFIYMLEPGRLYFSEEEVEALQKYLLNGGFLMVDDFWGEDEWWNFYYQIKRVFPNREPEEIPLDHEIFHAVFDLKERPQIPSIGHALNGRYSGVTWERWDAQEVHYKQIKDDKGRMMVVICHNTDLGDGWEREGENEWYFHQFSEKSAYPLGINIVFYAMTH